MDAKEIRLALREAGFNPIPIGPNSKIPCISEWQHKQDTTVDEVCSWPEGSTGILTKFTPTLDCDITHQEAAEAVREFAQEWFEDRGYLLIRFGQPPKFAVPFTTQNPFPKMSVSLHDGDKEYRVEFLGSGQQTVVAGIHPCGLAYRWHADRCLHQFRREDLPQIDKIEARELLDQIAAMLVSKFGFEVHHHTTNGNTTNGNATDNGPILDMEAFLSTMCEGNRHDVQLKASGSLLRKGMAIDAVVEMLIEATNRYVGTPATRDWQTERVAIERMCYDLVQKHPELSDRLPYKMREAFEVALNQPNKTAYFRHYPDKGWQVGAREASNKKTRFGNGYPTFRLVLMEPFDVHGLPARPWLYGRHYQRRRVSLTSAPGGAGKTSLMMVEGVAMAVARNLLGVQPEERLRIWYHCGEDDLQELQRRLAAICVHYKLDVADVLTGFYMTSGDEFPLKVARGYGELHIETQLMQAMADEVRGQRIDVAMLDPLITLHSVSEQDNTKMNQVIGLFKDLALECDCSVSLAAHMRKVPSGATEHVYTGDDNRGASAVRDAVRMARVINQMAFNEARDFGVSEIERPDYFCVERSKNNNAARGGMEKEWRRFRSVTIGRADNEEEIGVVEPWSPPDAAMPSPERVARQQEVQGVFLTLLDRFKREGREVNATKNTKYAPSLFAEEVEARERKVGKSELEEAMKTLIREIKIRIHEDHSRGHRHNYLVRT
jgi:RecA-family ATPase